MAPSSLKQLLLPLPRLLQRLLHPQLRLSHLCLSRQPPPR